MTARLHPAPLAAHGGRSRLPIDLSASLNPLGPSQAALEAARSAELTQLFIERCYKLADEDYAALAELDTKIDQLRTQ